MRSYLELQFNFRKFKSDQIYHKTLVNLSQHTYIKEIVGDYSLDNKIQSFLSGGNKVFVDLKELIRNFPDLEKVSFLISPWSDKNNNRINAFSSLNNTLYNTFIDKENKRLDLEIVYQFSQGLVKFSDIIEVYQPSLSLSVFRKLFNQFWQSESISFLGNPIDGLQIMGILETRTLDFENIIFVGMNEGVLPKSNPVNTFIPR